MAVDKPKGIITSISLEGAKELLWSTARTWLWPLLVTLLTPVLGYIQGLPLMYVFVATIATFAFITHGLVKITEWRFIRTPEHKIDFIEPNFGGNTDKDDPKHIKDIFLGARLRSYFGFPLQVDIVKLNTRFDDRVPKVKSPQGKPIDVGMQGTCFFNDEIIDIHDMDLKGKDIRASVDFTVKYGLPSDMRYTYSRSIDVIFCFDKEGILTKHYWHNSMDGVQ